MTHHPTPPVGGTPTAPADKPVMTQREANWHTHMAGMRATSEAQRQGYDPEAAAALLDAGVAGRRIGAHVFPPVHAGFLLMLGLVNQVSETLPSLKSESASLMAIAFCLGDPERAWVLLRAEDGWAAFEQACFEFASQFTLADLKDIGRWIGQQMELLKDPEPEDKPAGKSPAPAAGAGQPTATAAS